MSPQSFLQIFNKPLIWHRLVNRTPALQQDAKCKQHIPYAK